MFAHKIMRRLVVFLFVACNSMHGMDAPLTIKFEGTNTKDYIERPLISMFPVLQNLYDQGRRELTSTFSLQGVHLALEIARLKTKVNVEVVPLHKIIAQYKLALKGYSNDKRYEAANFAQASGNADLAELIVSLTQEMNIPKEAASSASSAEIQPTSLGSVAQEEEKNPVKQEVTKFVLKEGENIFTITKGYFPYIDTLMEFRPAGKAGTVEKPKNLSDFTIDIIDSKGLTALQRVIDQVNEKDPTFLTTPSYWSQYDRYKLPKEWETIVKDLFPVTTQTKDFVELAHAAEFLLSNPLKLLILDTFADRLVKGDLKSDSVPIESPDIDAMLAQIIVNKTILENTECVVIKAPMKTTGQYSISGNRSIFLCSTPTKKGGCFLVNWMDGMCEPHVLNEEQVLNQKWLRVHHYAFQGVGLTTDASSDLRYQVFVTKEPNRRDFNLIVQDTVGGYTAKPFIADADKDISIIFESSGYDFYFKASNTIFKCNAEKIFNSRNDLLSSNWKKVNLNDISDPFIQKYLNKEKCLCRCLEQKRMKKFDTRILHTLTYADSFLTKLKSLYNNADFNIIQTACDNSSYDHVLLMKDTQNWYYISHVSFAPDPRVQALLTCMNKLSAGNKQLYVNALCMHYIYASKWLLSTQELEGKLGSSMYNAVDPSMKAIIQNTLPSSLIGRSTVRVQRAFKHYSSFIKQNIGFLKLPAMALTAMAGAGMFTTFPLTVISSAVASSVIYNKWMQIYQERHKWTAPSAKDVLGTSVALMLFIPMIYIQERRANLGYSRRW